MRVIGVTSPRPGLYKPALNDVTRLLRSIAAGDSCAAEGLLPIVYGELHGLANRSMRGQGRDHTLQPTALVHEAWMKLVDLEDPDWSSRRHFLAVAAKAMRTVLIDHARARNAQKRGAGRGTIRLDEGAIQSKHSESLLELHEALDRLSAFDSFLAQLVELRFFGGLSVEEAAGVLGVSPRTVKRAWRTARAWLRRELDPEVSRDAS